MPVRNLAPADLAAWLADPARPRPQLLDVREPWEFQTCQIAGSTEMPMRTVPARLAELPDVPTAREVGLDLKGFRDHSWFGLFAPKGTPPEALKRISDEAARAAAQPDLQQKLLMVAQTAHHQSVEQFAQQVASDKVFFAALIKDLNLKLE